MVNFEEQARELVRRCSRANSETTVASRIEEILRDVLKEYGIDYQPIREKRVVRRGRIDSIFGAVVTEYKKRIENPAEWEEATGQLIEYIEGLAPEADLRDQYLGVVTDGRQVRFVVFDGGKAKIETPAPIDAHQLRRWVESLAALHRRGLTADNLVEDFAVLDATDESAGRRLALACYNSLGTPTKKTWMLRKEWQRLFAQSVDHRKTPEAHVEAYRAAFGFSQDVQVDHTRALFALQTTYAIIVKLVALRVLSEVRFGKAIVQFHELAALPSEELRRELERLENGHLLRDLQIDNLLEGDFFAWYVDPQQWNSDLYDAIKGVIVKLTDYEGRSPVLRPGIITDVFRQLYQRMMPPEIRHDLGEYYTPRWLAQATINVVPKAPGWKGLDPCCGSGTFVVEMINLVLEEVKHKSPEEQLANVLTRVKGIDLNPLAVLTSRVNYLLAIAPLLESVDQRIEIPVYLGDAAYIPQLVDLEGIPALTYRLSTDLGPLEFKLPLCLAQDSQKLGAVMLEVEKAVVSGNAAQAESALLSAIGSSSIPHGVVEAIRSLVQNLIRLEQQDWNRIWGRIIKNFIATAAIGTFDVVVGNPPWVEWKDLPDGYRDTINNLCRERGLFSDDRYSGGIDLNIAALIAHTVLEQWVAPGDYLCFLMPKSLLQLRSTQGFRRWKLPDGSPLALKRVDDWSELQPFDDAVTAPAGYLIQRGGDKPQMVPVTLYKGAGRTSRPQNATWEQVATTLQQEFLMAVQVSENGGPYMIDEASVLPSMVKLLGESAYRGRRATETAPHSVFWLRFLDQPKSGVVLVENDVNPRARNRVARSRHLVETTHLYPMLQGRHIRPYGVDIPEHLVLLPHDASTGQHAIPEAVLSQRSPLTYQYLNQYRKLLEDRGSRTEYRTGEPFYALWRVGPYTFAPYKVVWPEIGELRAAVVSTSVTPWGETKMVVPEGKVNLIACDTEDEAHFVCAFLNAPLVRRAYAKMSSTIGRPVRLPVAIPKYDPNVWTHRAMATVSKAAHQGKVQDPDRLTSWLLTRILARHNGDG